MLVGGLRFFCNVSIAHDTAEGSVAKKCVAAKKMVISCYYIAVTKFYELIPKRRFGLTIILGQLDWSFLR